MNWQNELEDVFDEETSSYTLEECPFTMAELSNPDHNIQFGTIDGILDYLRLKGEL